LLSQGSEMSFNYMDRMKYQNHVKELQEELVLLREQLQQERGNQRLHNQDVLNTSNYVNAEYFVESQYIHTLKKQIGMLIDQNNNLKIKNRELIEELEEVRGMV
jgi:hypothetical protein